MKLMVYYLNTIISFLPNILLLWTLPMASLVQQEFANLIWSCMHGWHPLFLKPNPPLYLGVHILYIPWLEVEMLFVFLLESLPKISSHLIWLITNWCRTCKTVHSYHEEELLAWLILLRYSIQLESRHVFSNHLVSLDTVHNVHESFSFRRHLTEGIARYLLEWWHSENPKLNWIFSFVSWFSFLLMNHAFLLIYWLARPRANSIENFSNLRSFLNSSPAKIC